jgi:hypothetical protein
MIWTIRNSFFTVFGLSLGLGKLIESPCTVAVVMMMKITSST